MVKNIGHFTGDLSMFHVAQLAEALRYNPEGHGFERHWNFSLT